MKSVVKFLVTLFEKADDNNITIMKVEKSDDNILNITYMKDREIIISKIELKDKTFEEMNTAFEESLNNDEKTF